MKPLALGLILGLTVGFSQAEENSGNRYVAQLGDCAACHTAPGGKPFAGGLAISSPFGAIYASNITPDPEHGIGDYTLDEFSQAVRQGVRKDGANLYPAMPYPSFAKVSDEDIAALYEFLMHEVQPVGEAVPRTELSFPYSQRWGLSAWNLVNRPAIGFTPSFDDDVLNRGAYLVEGLAHCGACHTPRDRLFAEEAYDASSEAYLSGSMLGDWPVPDLRGRRSAPARWDEGELIAYLTTGRNADTGVTGEMALVVEHSLQFASDDDSLAIARYLKSVVIDEPADTEPQKTDTTTAMLTAAEPDMELGARLYLDNCGACHTVSGRGAPRTIPSLVGNSLVTADQAGGLITVILKGARMPSTREAPSALAMPGFAHRLTDEEVAVLASFVRSAWTNDAGSVDEALVGKIRQNSEAEAP